ncbi:hypothetical protein [Jatrophihabitans endophyticus]|uniref:S8 family peptidase n=1 Tax=Jatrophihabitans endophyticus TaxID=1206085 RepID=UPI0019FC5018|nr:hypothetical protein [Jatrophihabitans endophyticus]MBE7186885.1 hypothetical protein [Jatrophihabitans endophyticus]
MTTALAVTPLLVAASVAAANAAPTASSHHSPSSTRATHPTPTIATAVRRQVAKHGDASVVVALRGDAATAHPNTRHDARAHAKAIAHSQSPVLSLLHGSGRASHVHAYHTFDVISADVTQAGLTKLAASKDVAVVAPNATIKMTPDTTPQAAAPSPVSAKPVTAPGGTCSSSKPELAPEALSATNTQSDDPDAKTARSLGATGAGVTVAFMAEGLDVNNPDFVRADGSPVFTDYQDFSGDGTSAPTDAGEAFLDASSIGAQGRETYNVSHFSDLPDKGACKIRIEGIAPGANLVALKVFGDNELALTSGFLQAIDYAVNTDHVDVLSESFGSNPVPDTTMDVIRQADEAAVAAGTTVTVSSGDAGVTNTIGSPSTSPGVISAGASTTLRYYLQNGYGGGHFPGVKGYLSNNISSLSSAGTDAAGGTVDLVAPGDLNWSLCTADVQQYFDCSNLAGQPTDVTDAGGTSESAPLTAAGAALVIQAYRQTHKGASPTPAVVKQLLISTASDIDAPGDQQGAGLLNTYRAVLAARSIPGSSVTPAAQGTSYVSDTQQIDVTGAEKTAVSKTVTVTNTGSTAQTITPSTRTLGNYTARKTQSVTLSKSSPTMIDWQGYKDPYRKITFKVPAGADRLDASIAYQAASSSLNARGRLTLIDPKGRLAMYSLPQGIGNYGDVQVAHPMAGTWTGYIYSRPAAAGGSLGRYQFGFRTAKYVSSGTVSGPLTLQPGASGTVTYDTTTPSTPGDSASSIVLTPGSGHATTIPVVLRSLVPLSTAGTPFTGTLTGGNGRDANTGVGEFYSFDVASGTPELNAQVTLARTPDPMFVSLIAPSGDQVGYGSNYSLAGLGSDPSPNLTGSAQVLDPAAGRWTMYVDFAPVVSGVNLSQKFSVLVNTAATTATPTGLPTGTGTTLPAGQATTAVVAVTNNTSEPQAYFADARTSQSTTYSLVGSDTSVKFPEQSEPTWLVPTHTTSVTDTLKSSKPAEFDFGPNFGDPDIESDGSGTNTSGTYSAPSVTQGEWYMGPQLVGPYGATASPTATGTAAMKATTQAFDQTVTSTTHDLWTSAINANAPEVKPVVVQPGKTGIITVTITPTGTSGSTVTGTLYVDSLASFTYAGVSPNANEVAALPYTYKIG